MSQRKLVSIGNYSLVGHCLGKGSFASVERSNHVIVKKEVALKVMKKKEITDEYVAKNYRREAEILAKLSHPNIVKLIEVLESKDFFCIAMELCSSGSLLNLLNNLGRINNSFAKKITRQMVGGLVYLHGKGFIHRDLKLENVLLCDDGKRVVIADFGLSSNWHLGRKMKTFCGSVEYAAPELFYKLDDYGPKVDVWSMGIIVYALVTGKLPFRAQESDMGSHTLIKRITGGMKKQQFDEMGTLDLNLRVFLFRCIETEAKVRYDARAAMRDQWLTSAGRQPLQDQPEVSLSQDNQLAIASTIKEGLKSGYGAEAILNHLKRRPYYSTGGMFNLLSLEFLEVKRKKAAAAEYARQQAQKLYPSLKQQSQEAKSQPAEDKASREPAWKRDRADNGELTRLKRKEVTDVDKENTTLVDKQRTPLTDLSNRQPPTGGRGKAATMEPAPEIKKPQLKPKYDKNRPSSDEPSTRQKLRIR